MHHIHACTPKTCYRRLRRRGRVVRALWDANLQVHTLARPNIYTKTDTQHRTHRCMYKLLHIHIFIFACVHKPRMCVCVCASAKPKHSRAATRARSRLLSSRSPPSVCYYYAWVYDGIKNRRRRGACSMVWHKCAVLTCGRRNEIQANISGVNGFASSPCLLHTYAQNTQLFVATHARINTHIYGTA